MSPQLGHVSDISDPTSSASVAGTPMTPPRSGHRGRRQRIGLVAVGVGFLLTLASRRAHGLEWAAAAGVGIVLTWFGLGFAIKGAPIARWGGGFILALILWSVGMSLGETWRSMLSGSDRPSTDPTAASTQSRDVPPPPPIYQLALLSSRGYESDSGGYRYVEGRVKNISRRSMHNVTVIATWYDKDGNFMKAPEALIGHNPILPGQTSQFRTVTSGSPRMSKFTVEFKQLPTGALRVDDQQGK